MTMMAITAMDGHLLDQQIPTLVFTFVKFIISNVHTENIVHMFCPLLLK